MPGIPAGPGQGIAVTLSTNMKKKSCGSLFLVFLLELLVLSSYRSLAGNLPASVLSELNSYNVVWTTPSTNGSPGSMPIGNGDITANVWVENNGGDLVMYIGKSDSWSEATRLLKVGRIRTHFSPNPFASGLPLSQTLNYYNGEIDIVAGASGSQVTLRIYVDANNPVIRIEASGQQNFTMSVSNEIWRSSTLAMNSGDSSSFYGVSSAPTTPSESADQALSLTDRLVWYHQNLNSYFGDLFTAENLSGDSGSYTDPWYNRVFGATVLATNFTVVNNQQLQSGSGTSFLVSIYPYTAQTTSESTWQSQMNTQIAQVVATSETTERTNHYTWWDNLWNRSWIFVSGDASATSVTSGYLAQRYVQACQGRGQYPIKFNGGTINYDYNGQNGDYRAWGPSYWNQNTRLLYWPMLACGDTDMIMPFFNMYTNMLPLQEAATSKYYNHGGAFFPETFNIFGLYNGDNWGWSDSTATYCSDDYIKYHFQGGLETLAMMLAYYNYTQNTSFATNYIIPMATQAIRFFEDHWSVVNGKLFFYPANACEMYWSCTNSTDYISGLMSDIKQLQALPANITTPALLTEWSNVDNELPPLPMDPTGAYIKPAQTYGAGMNTENPECYCIFPYRLYGLGLPDFGIGLNTFNNRTVQTYKYDWSQDPIEEALVGWTRAAETDVINNFNDTDPSSRYQAYWSTRNDYLPTEDTGGAAMLALQYMALQCVGNQIQILPAWPNEWNVDLKLNAPNNTTVRLVLTNEAITTLTVTPAASTNNLVQGYSVFPAIQAASYNTNSGTQTESCGEGGLDVGFITNGCYSVFNQVNLNGVNYFAARVASSGLGGSIQIRLDSPTGALVGTCPVPVTGGWQTWTNQYCNITLTNGFHNVYLVYTGGTGNWLFNLQWLSLTGPSTQIAASAYDSENSIQTESCVEGGLDVGYIGNGSYTVYDNIEMTGVTTFAARVASATTNGGVAGTIQIRAGSPTGTVLGTCTVAGTGGWQTWITETCLLTNTITGLQNIYLVYTGGYNVEWFSLQAGAPLLHQVEAASYNSENSIQTENNSEGGLDVGYISNGSYTVYNQINLTGVTSFDARVASNGAGGDIQVRLDSPTGTLVGTCVVPDTAGWQTWVTETCSITPTSGFHNIYLVYTGGAGNLFNVEWFTFDY
jgi:alpha-L-fucosidase 2